MVEEPASKKAKLEAFDNGDALDGLDELDKLEPLPQTDISSGPSTSQAGMIPGAVPGGNAAPFNHSSAANNSSGQPSVLQDLLMQPSQQTTTNSPRPGFGNLNQPTAGNFNTRSPMTSVTGPGASMMSPPNTSMPPSGRMSNGPGPSPGGPPAQGPPAGAGMQSRPPHAMYPGGDPSHLAQQQQQYMMQNRHMPGYPGGYPTGPPGAAYPMGVGRGIPGMRNAPQVINGVRPPQMRPGMMMDPAMMAQRMPGFPSGYPNQRDFMTGNYMPGRGAQPQYPTMHPGQQPGGPGMMVDPARINGPHIGAMVPPGSHPSIHPTSNAPVPNGVAQPSGGSNTSFAAQRPPSIGNPGTQQDPEKRKLIQQQLVLLLHAHKCQQREKHQNEQIGENGPKVANACNLPHCNTMKEVLSHMTGCNNGRSCQYAHCASSRQIIAHWKNCQREDCPVCKPLKNIQNNPTGNVFTSTDMNNLLGPHSVGPNSVSNFGGPHSADPLAGFGSPGPASTSGPNIPQHPGQPSGITAPGIPNQASQSASAQSQPHGQPSSVPTAASKSSNQLGVGNGPMSAAALVADFNPQQDPFRSPNPPNKTTTIDLKSSGLPAAIQLAINEFPLSSLPDPQPVTHSKPWHVHVTKDLRNHLVGKLVKAIFPSPDPNALLDQRIKDLITYARKVEREMYEMANDREEYYHLLAEKIYKIQKELQEKKNTRLDSRRPENVPNYRELEELNMPYPPNVQLNPDGTMPQNNWRQNGPSEAEIRKGVQDTACQLIQECEEFRNSEIARNAAASAATGTKDSGPSNEISTTASGTPTGMSTGKTSAAVTPTNGTPMQHTPGSISNGKPFMIKQEEGCSSVPSTSSGPQSVNVPIKQEPSTPRKDIVKRELTPPPGADENFDANELRNYLRPVWERLHQSEDAMPFRIPVDPQMLNIPDYFDIIKYPMDLGTIGHKLDTGAYRHPWEFCDDMWLMFDNAWLYNKKNSKVYKYSTKLSEMFVQEMDPVMKQMGYCCSKKLSFTPLALFCYGANMCTIARDQPYMLFEHNATNYGVTVNEKYTYCLKCFENIPPEGINLSDSNAEANYVSKDKFKQMKNNTIEYEPFETCKYCHRKWHRICALYDKKVFPDGFICDTCRKEKKYSKSENKYTAKKLPHNRLSQFLEDRVNGFLRGRLPGKSDNYEVIIRTLCVQDKEVEVKPLMKQRYSTVGFPEKFPYRTKAVFCFEVIDGVEVCFFGLHVQEYGSNSPVPNTRRVYIAYLDSVHFFQPRELRTDVYHEILLGYLDYAKKQGYTMAHIWACPPSEGDDYIFHCHPPEQKIPKPKRLQDWYKKMLEKGVAEKTVVEFKDIYKQARDDGLTTPMALPYFEGDFWPNVIEDIIKETNNEEAQRAKLQKEEDDDIEEDLFSAGDNGKKKSSKNKKNNLKKNSKMNKKKLASSTGNEVADKLFSQFEKHKEVFFTIRLVPQQHEKMVLETPTLDVDALMASEMMDGRDTFLSRARDDHWEFSSLRRAKYSTLCLCYALHENDTSKETAYCNKCQNIAKYHCNSCEDFDLCEKCNQTVKHEHVLEQIKSLIPSEGESGSGNRYESIQRCIQSLVHACQCRDANCRRMSCHKMKRVVQHTKMCKKRVNASCPVCKQLIALCCYHAKHCNKDSCSVPFCMNIRQKLAEQKRLSARRADMMMRRRMEGLHAGVSGGAAPTSSSSSTTNNASTPPSSSNSNTGMGSKGGGVGTASTALAGSSSLPPSTTPSLSSIGNQQRPGGAFMGSMVQTPNIPPHMANPPGSMQNRFTSSMQPPLSGISRPEMGGMINPGGRPGMVHNSVQRPGIGQPPSMNPPPYRPPSGTGQMPPGYPQQPGMNHSLPMPGIQGAGMRTSQQMQNERMMEQMTQLENRLRQTRTVEEQTQLFNELKRTPHLFSAFLKMSRNQEGQQMFPHATAHLQRESPYGQPGMPHAGVNPWQQQYQHRPGQPGSGQFPGMAGRSPSVGGPTSQMMPPQGQDQSGYR